MAQTREIILDAALRVIQEQGLARATTKEIAKAAGFSEAALYKHFTDKSEIFLGVLHERSPRFPDMQRALTTKPGTATVEANLAELASAAIAFYHHNFPMFASIFSDPVILDTHRTRLRQLGMGPHLANQALARYLAAEQQLGRVRADADVEAAADLFLGGCFQAAFLAHFTGRDRPDAPERYAALLRSLLA